jgi:hypothetical protein
MKNNSPLFISGVYRSGTTLPVKILNTHPQINITHDSVNFFRYYLKYAATIEEDYKTIVLDCADRLSNRFDIAVPANQIIKKLESADSINFAMVFQELMKSTFSDGKNDTIWGEKSLMQWSNIPMFLQMYEGAKALMIIRDPRNVLSSFRDFTIEPGARYLDAIFACLHALKWSSTIGKTLNPANFKLVYYENIISNPEAWVEEMCNFLKIPYHSGMADSNNFTDHTGGMWKPNTSYHDFEGKISINPANRWQEKLSKEELCFAESILGDEMRNHGYELSDVKIDPVQLNRLLNTLGKTDLLQHRMANWFETGNGVESHPSDPTVAQNWSKTMLPKDKAND